MGDNDLWAVFWAALSLIASGAIGAILYYNIEVEKLNSKLAHKLFENGHSPAVVKCLNTDWSSIGVYEICRQILTKSDFTLEETEELIKGIGKD